MPAALDTVRIVGTGLLGTSLGQALTQAEVNVVLHDSSPSSLALAVEYGAGRAASDADQPTLVVVAVPPDVAAAVTAAELERFSGATVTDLTSVKREIVSGLRAARADLKRYVGSHPMAGRERGGAISARADLFLGQPWVISAELESAPESTDAVRQLASTVGANVIEMSSQNHDSAVAAVSHLPQIVASLTAGRLAATPEKALRLSGQGLRDTTRIAASDPELWVQILSANHQELLPLLQAFREDLDALEAALTDPAASGAMRVIASKLAAGANAVTRIPGKHGGSDRFSVLTIAIDDSPGELARLLTEIGDLGVNVEDMRLEHSPGALLGFVEISVVPEVFERATLELRALGWRLR